jgi:protein arginine N-methyltransferase 1
MGNLLFQENMIEIVLDIRDRLLRKGGAILPNKFKFYVEPIELSDDHKLPFLWEYKFNNINYSSIKNLEINTDHWYYFRAIKPNEVKFILSEPSPLIEFDLETLHKDEISLNYKFKRTVQHAGWFDAFCLYFDAIFDDQIYLSTNPLNDNYPKSWVNIIYRVEPAYFSKNSEISYALDIGSLEDLQTWQFTPYS